MELKFFGNGFDFKTSHTNAYFEDGKDLILIDLSALNLNKISKLNLSSYENIFVFITHMHSDHVSGLGLFIEYCYRCIQPKKTIHVVVPDALVSNIMAYLRISGIDSTMYIITIAETLKTNFFEGKVIKTTHDPNLNNLCFGYVFYSNNKKIVYSGDTNNPKEFSKVLKGAKEFYCEISSNPLALVHTYYPSYEDFFLNVFENGTDVYFMHVDDFEKVKGMIGNKPFFIVWVED